MYQVKLYLETVDKEWLSEPFENYEDAIDFLESYGKMARRYGWKRTITLENDGVVYETRSYNYQIFRNI